MRRRLSTDSHGRPALAAPAVAIQVGRYCQCVADPHKWVIHGERVVDDTPHVRVSLTDVELSDGVRFTQYVFKMRRAAMAVVLDDPGERVLLVRRHRFIVDRWVWELPGGYVDDREDPADAAAREVQEETGWRPRRLEYVLSCQPMIGNATIRGIFTLRTARSWPGSRRLTRPPRSPGWLWARRRR